MASLFHTKISNFKLSSMVSLETAFTFIVSYQYHRVTEKLETARLEVFLGRIGNDGCLANGQVW